MGAVIAAASTAPSYSDGFTSGLRWALLVLLIVAVVILVVRAVTYRLKVHRRAKVYRGWTTSEIERRRPPCPF